MRAQTPLALRSSRGECAAQNAGEKPVRAFKPSKTGKEDGATRGFQEKNAARPGDGGIQRVADGDGGAGRDRTGDLLVANEALSQLSYSPTTFLSYQRAAHPQRRRRAFTVAELPLLCLLDRLFPAPTGREGNSPYSWFMLARNSALLRTFSRRLMSSSMASTGESGLSTLRRIQMRCKSSLGMSSSSLRVPER